MRGNDREVVLMMELHSLIRQSVRKLVTQETRRMRMKRGWGGGD